jgi:nucleoside-diphosphate-sugar epimerase
VLNQYDISDVYHLAAQSIVKRAWKDPIGTFDINVMGTVKLLEACRLLDVKNVIVQSTDKVYGNQMNADLNCNLKPTEPYGTSKICEDYIARTFNITYGLKILTVRCCNIFGYDWNNRIIPNTIRACLKGESPVIFEDDASVRQYIYIDDVTEILQRLMEEMKMPDAELWHPLVNVGAPIILTQEEVVLKILSTCFPNTFIKPHYIKKPEILEIHSQSMAHYRQAENPTTFENGIMKTVTAFRRYS